jgi:hypothetical protein
MLLSRTTASLWVLTPIKPEEKQMITQEKKLLTVADIDAQAAFELPARETLALVNVFITNVLNNLSISIPVQNNNVAVQVCAVVQALNTILVGESLTCTIQQR